VKLANLPYADDSFSQKHSLISLISGNSALIEQQFVQSQLLGSLQ
jgi:hypothetical protein